jgi:NADP-dependent 3-hydroxy acid dehydrogenase YdfG
MDLADAAVLVTGASSGIGRATAERFGEAGARVALTARPSGRLDAAAAAVRDAGGTARVVPADVTDPRAVEDAVSTAVGAFGGLDVAVVNAGVGTPRDDPADLGDADYETIRGVNVDGAFYTARAALPPIRATAGALIFVGSFSGKHPRPEFPVYAASKYWVRGLALSLAGAEGPDDVAVSLVNPSEVRTALNDTFGPPNDERFAPGEVTEPAAVADAIAFAATRDPPDAATEVDLFRRDRYAEF